jgi:transcriptional regulator with XRE-family HTH domain
MPPSSSRAASSVEIHGPALRVIRQLLNVKVEDLTGTLKCTPGYISKIETGRSPRVSQWFFTQLLDYLGLNTPEGRRALQSRPVDDTDGPDTAEMARPVTDPSGIPVDALAGVPKQRTGPKHRASAR